MNSDCGQSCLVLDEFLDSVVHRRRVKGILRVRGVRGELVDNATAWGIPQKGDILVVRRHGGYAIGSFVVWLSSVSTHLHEEGREAQIDPKV